MFRTDVLARVSLSFALAGLVLAGCSDSKRLSSDETDDGATDGGTSGAPGGGAAMDASPPDAPIVRDATVSGDAGTEPGNDGSVDASTDGSVDGSTDGSADGSVEKVADGATCTQDAQCNAGSLCEADVCTRGCRIDDVFRIEGTPNAAPQNCETCDPDQSTSGWSLVSAGTVCREGSGDLCDPDEACTGSAAQCPDDVVAPVDTECRGAQGDCDVPEVCSGVAGESCPADQLVPGGTECRARAGACDIAEVCTGASAECPTDAREPATTVCRRVGGTLGGPPDYTETVSAGALCDVAEYCTGLDVDCPEDGYQPSGYVCRPIDGVCDTQAETCSGSNKECPFDISTGSNLCRPSRGACDPPEFCGTDPDCPSDVVVSAGTPCRGPRGICDEREVCDGVNPTCPAETGLLASGVVCREAQSDCDVEEVCTGDVPVCPPNAIAPNGTPCGGGVCVAGICNAPTRELGETCRADGECISGNCGETLERRRVCLESTHSGFGDSCDGHATIGTGDPNQQKCSNEGGTLWCCNGSRAATAGETGTCEGCCTTDDDSVGCPNSQEQCCDGRCANLTNDVLNCGQCGVDCRDDVDGCFSEVSGCDIDAECRYEYACEWEEICIDHDELCALLGGSFCNQSGIQCGTEYVVEANSSCERCGKDADCPDGETCWSGCGVGTGNTAVLYSGTCFVQGYCADDPSECGLQ